MRNFCFIVQWEYYSLLHNSVSRSTHKSLWCVRSDTGKNRMVGTYMHIHTIHICPAGFEHQHTRIAQRVVHWIIDENVRVIYAIKICRKKMRFRFFFTSQIFWSNGLFVIDLFRVGRYIIMRIHPRTKRYNNNKKINPIKKCIHFVTYIIFYYIYLYCNFTATCDTHINLLYMCIRIALLYNFFCFFTEYVLFNIITIYCNLIACV